MSITTDLKISDNFIFETRHTLHHMACFILLLYNPAMPSIHPVLCDSEALHAVVCQKDSIYITNMNLNNKIDGNIITSSAFLCPNGEYISNLKICDGKNDCFGNPVDEMDCLCSIGPLRMTNRYCAESCHPANCSCANLYRQGKHGGCYIYWKEIKFYHPILYVYSYQSNFQLFNCSNNIEIHYSLVNDLIPDCTNNSDEPLMMLTNSFQKKKLCQSQHMLECYPGHIRCYFPEHQCQYYLSSITNLLLVCRNGKHLENCGETLCTYQFKCPQSYCISYNYVCNGVWDCWNGYDEYKCTSQFCRGLYSCIRSSNCVPLDCLCNGISDCRNSDDEMFCIKCLDGCKYVGLAILCEDKTFKIPYNVIYLGYFSFVRISESRLLPFYGLNETVILFLSNNNISEFLNVFTQSNYNNLKVLLLHSNKLTTVKYSTKYSQLLNIVLLNLSHNIIHNIENFAFTSH